MTDPTTPAEREAWAQLFAAISSELHVYVRVYDHDRHDSAWALGYGKTWQEQPPA